MVGSPSRAVKPGLGGTHDLFERNRAVEPADSGNPRGACRADRVEAVFADAPDSKHGHAHRRTDRAQPVEAEQTMSWPFRPRREDRPRNEEVHVGPGRTRVVDAVDRTADEEWPRCKRAN